MILIKNENIICPNCQATVTGEIKESPPMPFLLYFGYCKKCEYHILESEWEAV